MHVVCLGHHQLVRGMSSTMHASARLIRTSKASKCADTPRLVSVQSPSAEDGVDLDATRRETSAELAADAGPVNVRSGAKARQAAGARVVR